MARWIWGLQQINLERTQLQKHGPFSSASSRETDGKHKAHMLNFLRHVSELILFSSSQNNNGNQANSYVKAESALLWWWMCVLHFKVQTVLMWRIEEQKWNMKYPFLLLIYEYQKHFYTLNIFRKLQRDTFFYYVAFEIVNAMNIWFDTICTPFSSKLYFLATAHILGK